jgi:hypothetical protein
MMLNFLILLTLQKWMNSLSLLLVDYIITEGKAHNYNFIY